MIGLSLKDSQTWQKLKNNRSQKFGTYWYESYVTVRYLWYDANRFIHGTSATMPSYVVRVQLGPAQRAPM